eukprot:5018295-Pyramimonas_sp.AAC.1
MGAGAPGRALGNYRFDKKRTRPPKAAHSIPVSVQLPLDIDSAFQPCIIEAHDLGRCATALAAVVVGAEMEGAHGEEECRYEGQDKEEKEERRTIGRPWHRQPAPHCRQSQA